MRKFSSFKYKLMLGMAAILFLAIFVCVISFYLINNKKEKVSNYNLLAAYKTIPIKQYKEKFDALDKRVRKVLWSANIAENIEKRQVVALKDYLDGIAFSLEEQEGLTRLVALDSDFQPLYYIEDKQILNIEQHLDADAL
ncbi:MAG: hypothetical protein KKD05_01045, partial [Candidatus Omnitrophica bacterium]|nr:hypothetical protein [Candidatus Omnitrophota bacterium]